MLETVVFGSGTGTNLEALFKEQEECPLFEIKALLCDRPCRFQEIGLARGIPVIEHSFDRFFQGADSKDIEMRMRYDEEAVRLLEACASKWAFSIDLICLCGYMRKIFSPLLHRFENKIINVHPADLTCQDERGHRCYTGSHAVYDALIAGERQTRSTVHLVNEEIDGGKILVLGPWVDYNEGYPITQERAKSHQDRQKIVSDQPALIEAVKLMAQVGV